jgi:hypothetical protein
MVVVVVAVASVACMSEPSRANPPGFPVRPIMDRRAHGKQTSQFAAD